ncbi:mycothiol synthase [Arthrobacter sp.]|uniref:mycothiol synthase n=1 Tax=Arthrobacter sp. TaxID=1667 RepID=UPI003A8D3D72
MSATQSTDWTITTATGRPDGGLLRRIATLAADAEDTDGNPPLSEQTLVDLRTGEADGGLLLVAAWLADDEGQPSGELIGVAVAVVSSGGEPGTLEIVVHPEYRNDGIGAALLATLAAQKPAGQLQAWSHGNHEAAARLAQHHGYAPVRELWKMRLMHDAGLPAARMPDGYRLRTFVPGQDEQPWLDANAAAFAHHAEQGAMTAGDLRARMEEDWFDPEGFLLAEAADGSIAGFHWTKVHPAMKSPTTGEHQAVGEVYVVGVVPSAQGTGLGRALTIAGIEHLRSRGLSAVMLYVDADNTAAVGLYRQLGFTRWDVDVMYAQGTPTAG